MPRWALISVHDADARGACVLEVVEALRARGLSVAGFVQTRDLDVEGRRRQAATRLARDEQVALMVRGVAAKDPAKVRYCNFTFDTEAFERARTWIAEDAEGSDVLVLGDVGSLEASGEGHTRALRAALDAPDSVVVLAVQPRHLYYVMERFGLDEPLAAVESSGETEADLVDAVAAAVLRSAR